MKSKFRPVGLLQIAHTILYYFRDDTKAPKGYIEPNRETNSKKNWNQGKDIQNSRLRQRLESIDAKRPQRAGRHR